MRTPSPRIVPPHDPVLHIGIRLLDEFSASAAFGLDTRHEPDPLQRVLPCRYLGYADLPAFAVAKKRRIPDWKR